MKETEKYEEQLKKIQQAQFNVPDRYFEDLPGKVMDKIDLLEGKKTAISNPFSTPENYFNELPNAVTQKVNAKPAFKPLFSRPAVLIPLACAILVIGFFIFTNENSNERIQYYTIDEIENSTYLQTINEDILIDELASMPSSVSPDSLMQYIIDNNISLSDLENAL